MAVTGGERVCDMVGVLCVRLCLKKSAFSLSPSSPPSERGEKKGEDAKPPRTWGRRPSPCRPVPGLRKGCGGAAGWWGQDWHARLRIGQAKWGLRSERAPARSERCDWPGRSEARAYCSEAQACPERNEVVPQPSAARACGSSTAIVRRGRCSCAARDDHLRGRTMK